MTVHTRGATGFGRHTVGPSDRGDDWRDVAACRGIDPELFYIPGDSEAKSAPAVRVCDGCPVAEQCLGWALKHGEDHGVWGGTTPKQRRALRLKYRIKTESARVCMRCAGPMSPKASSVAMYCSARCHEAAARSRQAAQ